MAANKHLSHDAPGNHPQCITALKLSAQNTNAQNLHTAEYLNACGQGRNTNVS